MSTPVRLLLFGVALIAVFAIGWTAGAAVGPLDDNPPVPHSDTGEHGQ